MTYLKCAAVTVQKAVRRLAARRVLQQLLHETQAAAETKEEEAAKKASGPSKLVLRDKGLRDLAKFARRSAKKARRLVAKAEKSPADKVAAEHNVEKTASILFPLFLPWSDRLAAPGEFRAPCPAGVLVTVCLGVCDGGAARTERAPGRANARSRFGGRLHSAPAKKRPEASLG